MISLKQGLAKDESIFFIYNEIDKSKNLKTRNQEYITYIPQIYIYIVGSRFSDRAHYNEFVESGAKSWALMRRWLVLGMKGTQNWAAQRPREKGPLARGRECVNPS